jgi:uncharacterized membrane protein YqjE
MQEPTLEPEAPLENASAGELVREALDEARYLVRLEVALAKEEVKREVGAAKSAGIAFGVAAAASLLGVALILVAFALAIFPGPLPALVMGLILVAAGALAGVTGRKLLPKKPLVDTRHRLETDLETLKEHVV